MLGKWTDTSDIRHIPLTPAVSSRSATTAAMPPQVAALEMTSRQLSLRHIMSSEGEHVTYYNNLLASVSIGDSKQAVVSKLGSANMQESGSRAMWSCPGHPSSYMYVDFDEGDSAIGSGVSV
ncbi:hypothetical protein EV174_003716 [Coemansia sp. RSA 2320]|nr:hypothetical protein EV174_003716 [Coemansia sp. RSA 2320]